MNCIYICNKKIFELIKQEIYFNPIKRNQHIFFESLCIAIEVIDKNLADEVFLFTDQNFYENYYLSKLHKLKDTMQFRLTEIKFEAEIPVEYIRKKILPKLEI